MASTKCIKNTNYTFQIWVLLWLKIVFLLEWFIY